MKRAFILIVLMALGSLAWSGEKPKKQFVYILKCVPRLTYAEDWTDKDNAIVYEHFQNLQRLLKEDKLILAGKTDNQNEHTFGIVIIETESEEEAREIMNNDPAVAKKIMTAELSPYQVALIRK